MSPYLRQLATENSIPLPWPGSWRRILEGLSRITALVGGGSPALLLNFEMEKQKNDLWCWAATSKSTSHFYNPASAWTQCSIAEAALNLQCCENAGPCDQTWFLDRALTITGNLATFVDGTITINQIRSELESSRIVGARIGWHGGGGHFMVVYGCRLLHSDCYLSIDDPIYGKSEVSEDSFRFDYRGAGSWTHSYLTN